MKKIKFCNEHKIEKVYLEKHGKYECRICKTEYAKKYREINKDLIKQKNKAYNALVREKRQELIRNDRLLNPEKYKKYGRDQYNRNKVEINLKKSLRKYKLTLTEYNELLVNSNYVCSICKKPENRKTGKGNNVTNLSIDHDHITSKVRGILCFRCNIGLGKFNDDEELLQNAILYLRKFK